MIDSVTTLKQIAASSSDLAAWALAIFGGTVAIIVSTSYRRPDSFRRRIPYLLFLPGWASVGYSLYLANVLIGKYLASLMVHEDQIAAIASQINDVYAEQRLCLLASLVFFGSWLLIYLLSWIFSETIQKVE